MADKKLCSVDGCTRKAQSRGWCQTHYMRWYTHGDLREGDEVKGNMTHRLCSVSGCTKPARKRNWCGTHYERWRVHGDANGGRGRKTPSGAAKKYFLEVVLTHEGDDCLAWPFMTDRMGYGMLDGRYVHIMVCEYVNGTAPGADMEAAHSCGNGRGGCCSKRHLRWRTHAENQKEMVEHGHSNRGTKHPAAILTEADVRYIRSLGGNIDAARVSKKYGVSIGHIWKIIHRKRWAWLDD